MKFVVVHALWLYGQFLGKFTPHHSADHGGRAGELAAARVLSVLSFLKEAFDRVLVVADTGYSFRTDICEAHDEREEPWPQAAWDGYHATISSLREDGYRVIDPVPLEQGAELPLGSRSFALAGAVPAGRDIIATIAREWRGSSQPAAGDRLRIVSGSHSLAFLVDDSAGIDLAHDVREADGVWGFSVVTSRSVGAWVDAIATRAQLVGDVQALAQLPEIDVATARALVCGGRIGATKVTGHGSAESAVEAACHRGMLPGLNARQIGALRAAGERGRGAVLRALALAHVRDDVPIDLTEEWAALRGRVESGHVPATQPSVVPAADEGACGEGASAVDDATAKTVQAHPTVISARPTSPTQDLPMREARGVDRDAHQREQQSVLRLVEPLPAAARSTAPTPAIARAQPDGRPRAVSRPYQFEAVEATREQVILRAGLCGPSGSGKTLTALKVAARMVDTMGIGPLFVIDTEHGSSKRYAFSSRTGEGYRFRVIPMEHDFSPAAYVAALEVCEDSGAGVIVIDSLSHAWSGINGVLELVDQRTDEARGRGPASSGWKLMSPIQARFVERIMQSSAHILFTVRAKTEWTADKNGEGKLEQRRIGLQPVQRDGLEYEPDLFFDMSMDNTLSVTKSRVFDCAGLENGASYARPGVEFADLVIGWLQDGTPRVDELADQVKGAVAASKDRPSYEAAKKALVDWMRARNVPRAKGEAALATLLRRARAAAGAVA